MALNGARDRNLVLEEHKCELGDVEHSAAMLARSMTDWESLYQSMYDTS